MPLRIHLVRRIVAFEDVGPRAAQQHVRAAPAHQGVVALATVQKIVTRLRAVHAVLVTKDLVVARSAIEDVVASAPPHAVVARAAIQHVVAVTRGLQHVAHHHLRTVDRQRLHRLLPGGRHHVVVAVQPVVARSAVNEVVAVVARHHVVAGAREHGVVARAGIHHVVTRARVDRVRTGPRSLAHVAHERLAAVQLRERLLRARHVLGRVTLQRPDVLRPHRQQARGVHLRQRVDAERAQVRLADALAQAVVGGRSDLRQRHARHQQPRLARGRVVRARAMRVGGIAHHQRFTVAVGQDDVRASPAHEGIVTRPAVQHVVTPAAQQPVVPAPARQAREAVAAARLRLPGRDGRGQVHRRAHGQHVVARLAIQPLPRGCRRRAALQHVRARAPGRSVPVAAGLEGARHPQTDILLRLREAVVGVAARRGGKVVIRGWLCRCRCDQRYIPAVGGRLLRSTFVVLGFAFVGRFDPCRATRRCVSCLHQREHDLRLAFHQIQHCGSDRQDGSGRYEAELVLHGTERERHRVARLRGSVEVDGHYFTATVLHCREARQRLRLESRVFEWASARLVAQGQPHLGFQLDAEIARVRLRLGQVEVVDRDRVSHVARARDDQLLAGGGGRVVVHGQSDALAVQVGHPYVGFAGAFGIAQGLAVDLDRAEPVLVQNIVAAEAASELVGIGTQSAQQRIVAIAAGQYVVASAREDEILPRARVEHVGTVRPQRQVALVVGNALVVQRPAGRHRHAFRQGHVPSYQRRITAVVQLGNGGLGFSQDALHERTPGTVSPPRSLHIGHLERHAARLRFEQRLERPTFIAIRRGIRARGAVVVPQHTGQNPFLEMLDEPSIGHAQFADILAKGIQHLVRNHRLRAVRTALRYAELVAQDVLGQCRVGLIRALNTQQIRIGEQPQKRLVPLRRQIEALVSRPIAALQHQRQQCLRVQRHRTRIRGVLHQIKAAAVDAHRIAHRHVHPFARQHLALERDGAHVRFPRHRHGHHHHAGQAGGRARPGRRRTQQPQRQAHRHRHLPRGRVARQLGVRCQPLALQMGVERLGVLHAGGRSERRRVECHRLHVQHHADGRGQAPAQRMPGQHHALARHRGILFEPHHELRRLPELVRQLASAQRHVVVEHVGLQFALEIRAREADHDLAAFYICRRFEASRAVLPVDAAGHVGFWSALAAIRPTSDIQGDPPLRNQYFVDICATGFIAGTCQQSKFYVAIHLLPPSFFTAGYAWQSIGRP